MQLEREKLGYDLENVQTQLDKALGQAARTQKERETLQLEVDRLRDKYDKSQVRPFFFFLFTYVFSRSFFL